MSCKYEEIYFPGVNEFLLTTQNSYTPEEVYQMEADILIQLNFDISQPTSYTFLELFIDDSDKIKFKLCSFLLEMTMIEYKMKKYTDALIAYCTIKIIF